MNYLQLKSGSDVRGYASDKGGKEVELTDSVILNICKAFAVWLAVKKKKSLKELTISLGHDSRITADRILSCAKEALNNSGVSTLDCGLSSTPAMFMTTVELCVDGAMQITASHHPFDRNGLKFFTREGGLDGKDIEAILKIAEDGEFINSETKGSNEAVRFMDTYAKSLRQLICKELDVTEQKKPLSGYHIVVDAGNGVGGFYVDLVLKPLGADTSGSRFLEPDGMFPNHIPNPEDAQAMRSICDAVRESGADLGIIFDTDVDRAGCVDRMGNEINRNRLIALSSVIVLQKEKGATIVTDSVTSDGLKTFIEEHGGVHRRFKRGYKNVINEAVRLCEDGVEAPLAIETSGHAALRENYFLDDGAYLMTKIVIELARLKKEGKDLDILTSSLKMPLEEQEYRFLISGENFKEYGMKVLQDFEQFITQQTDFTLADDSCEGVRASCEYGWFLLRLSVHDPNMPFNIESDSNGGAHRMLEKLKPFFKTANRLSCDALSL